MKNKYPCSSPPDDWTTFQSGWPVCGKSAIVKYTVRSLSIYRCAEHDAPTFQRCEIFKKTIPFVREILK